jgi:hypothetical protein
MSAIEAADILVVPVVRKPDLTEIRLPETLHETLVLVNPVKL